MADQYESGSNLKLSRTHPDLAEESGTIFELSSQFAVGKLAIAHDQTAELYMF